MHSIQPGPNSLIRLRPISGKHEVPRRVFRGMFIILAGFGLACEAALAQPEIDVDPAALETTLQQDQSESQSLTIANLGSAALDWEITEDGAAGTGDKPARPAGLPAARSASSSVFGGVSSPAGMACGAPGAGDCCAANGTPFCDDEACCSTICDIDPFCCNTEWDSICADEAQDLCAVCGGTPPASCELPEWLSADPTGGSVPGSDSQLVDVSFDTTGLAIGAYEANLCIASNDPVNSLVVVPVTMSVVGPPEIEVDPEQLEPVLAPDDDTVETLTIANLGGAALAWEVTEDGTAGAQSRRSPGLLDAPRTSPSVLDGIAAPAGLACGSPGSGDCCANTGTPFCEDESCCSTICDIDPFCCNTEWDSICADQAQDLCAVCQAGPDCTLPQWMSANPAAGSVPGGNSQLVDVSFDTTGLAIGAYEANLCIASNDPVNSLVVVPVAMSVSDAVPVLSVDPDTLNFGTVAIGGSAGPNAVTLTSSGTIAVEVTAIDAAAAPFERTGGDCPATPFELGPAASCTLAYTFAPTAVGSFGQTLNIGSNADPAGFTLTGEAIEPGPEPRIGVDPAALGATLHQDQSETQILSIANLGTEPLTWEVAATWLAQESGLSAELWDVAFANELIGMAVGTHGTILRTDDGGATWTLQDAGSGTFFFGVALHDALTATVVGNGGVILRTADGGASWTQQTSGVSQQLRDVYFEDAGTGWAVGGSRTILHTADGGQNWQLQLSGSALGGTLRGVHFIDAQKGWAVGPVILSTQDGGETWSEQSGGDGSTLHDVQFSTDQLGIAVSNNLVLRTDNGGETWVSVLAEGAQSVSFADTLTGMVVGGGGKILRTHDAGATWFQEDKEGTGFTTNLNGVWLHSPDGAAWAVGANGVILRRTGGGWVDHCQLPPWVSVEPLDGTVESGESQPVAVTFDTAGLDVGDYEATLCLASNDPLEPLVEVPLDLTVLPTVKLEFDPPGLDFVEVAVGDTSAPLEATLHNIGTAEATGLDFTAPGGDFSADTSACGDTLAIGASCAVSVTFAPTAVGPANAELHVDSAQGFSATLDLAGIGVGSVEPELTFTPASLDFGDVDVGTGSLAQTALLQNTGEVMLTELVFIPPGNGFVADWTACGDDLPAGESCGISVYFSPSVTGPASGTLEVLSEEGAVAVLALDGNGAEPLAPELAFIPAGLDFGDVQVGTTTESQTVMLENTGTAAATGLFFTTPEGGFEVDASACGETLAAGESCPVGVSFTPEAAGSWDATLMVTSAEGVSTTLGAQPPDKHLYLMSQHFNGIMRMDSADIHSGRPVLGVNHDTRVVRGLAVDMEHCAYYWIQGGLELRRVNIDGTGEEVAVAANGFNAVVIDAASGTIYYSQFGTINRAELGPAGLMNIEPVLTTPGPDLLVGGLALDIEGERIYWSTYSLSSPGSAIWSATLDGTDIQLLRDTSAELSQPVGVSLDLHAAKVYWGDRRLDADSGELRIHRANLDGTGYEVVFSVPVSSGHSGVALRDLAVDPDLGKLFFSSIYFEGEFKDKPFLRSNLDGSKIEAISALQDSDVSGYAFVPGDIDAQCGPPAADFCPPGADCNRVESIYWGNSGLWRAKADGSRRARIDEVGGSAIAISRELRKVYTARATEVVACSSSPTGQCVQAWRTDLDGANPEVVLQMPYTPESGQYLFGIAVDVTAEKIYVVQRRRDGFEGHDIDKATLWQGSLDGSDLEPEVRFVLDAPGTSQIPGDVSHMMGGPVLDVQSRLGYVTAEDAIYRFDLDSDESPEVLMPSLPGDLWPEPGPSLWEFWGSAHAPHLDPLRGKLYWRQGFRSDNALLFRTYRSDLDGTQIEQIAWIETLSPARRERRAQAMDPHSRRMYGHYYRFSNRDHIYRWEFERDDAVPSAHTHSSSIKPIALLPATAVAELALAGTGVGPAVSLTPEALDFGEQAVGASSPPQIALLENIGDADLTGLAFDAGSEFVLETDDCGATLAVGASCELGIRFAPTDTGPVAATLQVTSDQGAAAAIELTGLGIPHPPLIDVDPDSFGLELAEGDSASESLTISNLGDEALNWSIETADPAGGQSALLTLPAGVPVTAALASGTGTDQEIAGTGSLLLIGDAQMSQTADTNIVPSNSVACPAGPNHLLRRFYFDEHPEVGITAEIGSVDIAIQEGVASQLLTVNLYTIPSDTPVDTIPLEALELIGSGSVAISSADDFSTVNVPVGATVVNTQAFDLVVEATANVFFIGATDAGQRHPGFLVAPSCGAPTPTPIDSIGPNFEDTHIIMVVNADADPCFDAASVPWLSVEPAAGSTAPGSDSSVDVQVDSDGLVHGDYEALLCIDSNDPANPRVRVPVSLSVLQLAPGITVTPAAHDFGAVAVGDSSDPVTITIESTGTDDLQVDSIGEPGSAFAHVGGSCEPAPFTLQPGTSCTLDYGFTPQSEGAFTGIATIASNADPAVIGVALTGEGEGESPDALFRDRFEEDTP